MRVVEIVAPGRVELRAAPLPSLGENEVLLGTRRVGICGSDVHAYHGRHPFISLPVRPGHELVGTVVEVGAAVCAPAIGDRVVVEPSVVCGACESCVSGRYNICDHLRVLGCQAPGGMADYVAVGADRVIPVPASLGDDDAVLAEPLAVAVHAARVGRIAPGDDVAILGAGTIGLLCLQIARSRGARRVVISDPMPSRRSLALELGADAAVDPTAGRPGGFGDPFDVVMECVGVASTVRDAVAVARKGARIVLAGVFSAEVPVEVALIQDREIELLGTLMYTRRDFDDALRLLRDGMVGSAPLVTHEYPLEDAAVAYRVADSDASALKVVLALGADRA
jgi:L-iditol 2-dehydrogenase